MKLSAAMIAMTLGGASDPNKASTTQLTVVTTCEGVICTYAQGSNICGLKQRDIQLPAAVHGPWKYLKTADCGGYDKVSHVRENVCKTTAATAGTCRWD